MALFCSLNGFYTTTHASCPGTRVLKHSELVRYVALLSLFTNQTYSSCVGVEEFPIHTRELLDHDRQQSRANGGTSKNNILSQLLQASENPVDPDGKSTSARQTEALTDRELLGNLCKFQYMSDSAQID